MSTILWVKTNATSSNYKYLLLYLLAFALILSKGQIFFFIILAYAGPLSLILVIQWGINPDIINTICSILMLVFMQKIIDKNIRYIKIILQMILIFSLYLLFKNIQTIMILIHLFIIIELFKLLMNDLFNNNIINAFHVGILFYELTILISLFVFLLGTETGYIYFYTTAGFQIILAIFFSIFHDKSSRLQIKLKGVNAG